MARVKTRTVREEWDVNRRLAELKLDKERLLTVRSRALGAAADATPFHPANAAGTFSYQHGTFALRDEFVGGIWSMERPDGVEAIRCDEIMLKVVFANVDVACDDEREPKPRSRKGAGAERICSGNLFGDLPRYAPKPEGDWSIYYLMVAENGATELSCPIVERNTFGAYVERIYLSDGSDFDGEAKLGLDDDDIVEDFDPQVARK